MSRRSSYSSGVLRSTQQFVWLGMLLVLVAVMAATGLWAAFFGWIGDLLLDQIEQIGNAQPE